MGMKVKSRATLSNTEGKQPGASLPLEEAGFQVLAEMGEPGII
jgi:hypothetical protein